MSQRQNCVFGLYSLGHILYGKKWHGVPNFLWHREGKNRGEENKRKRDEKGGGEASKLQRRWGKNEKIKILGEKGKGKRKRQGEKEERNMEKDRNRNWWEEEDRKKFLGTLTTWWSYLHAEWSFKGIIGLRLVALQLLKFRLQVQKGKPLQKHPGFVLDKK